MPPTKTPRRSKARSTSLWMRLKQKPFKTTIIPPDTGQSIIPIPNAWPQPELPLWRDLEYRSKLPLPSWHKWTLCCGPMSHGYIPKWPGAVFDTWDINVHVYDTEYHPLHDPALRVFCYNRWKTLLRQNLITPDGQVKATLRQFNQWRRHLSRHQHQLMVKKQAIARRDELCDTIRGFMHVLNRTSLNQPIRREAGDVTDEQADPLYREGEEHNALLVELSKLHDLSKQVRVEILKYNRKVSQDMAEDKERKRQLNLLTTLYAKEQEVLVRRYYQKVVLFAEKRKQKAADLLERRMQSQTADGQKAEEMNGKIRMRIKHNADMWKRIYRRLHEKNRPKLPSERKKRTGTVAVAEQIVSEMTEEQEAQTDKSEQEHKIYESQQEDNAEAGPVSSEEVAKSTVTMTESDRTLRRVATDIIDELLCSEPETTHPAESSCETGSGSVTSFEDIAKRYLEDLLNNAMLLSSQLSIHQDRTSPRTASSHAHVNVSPVLVPSKQPSNATGRDLQEKRSSNSGDSKLLPRIMRSAMSKSNANNHRGSDHRHISFAPNAADEPVKPTAKKSTDKLDRCGLTIVDQTKSAQDEEPGFPTTNRESVALLQCRSNARADQNVPNQASVREVVVGSVVVPRSEHQMQQAVYVPAKSRSRLEPAGTPSVPTVKQSDLLPLRDNSPGASPSKEKQDFWAARSSEHQTRLLEASHSALSTPGAEPHGTTSQKDSLTMAGDLIDELVTEPGPEPTERPSSVKSHVNDARSDNSVIMGRAIVDGLTTSEIEIKPVSSDEDEGYVVSIPIKSMVSAQIRPYAGLAAHVSGSEGRSQQDLDARQASETTFHSSPTLVTAADIVDEVTTTEDIVDDVTPSESVHLPASQTSLPKLRKSPTLDAALDIIDDLTSTDDMFFNIYSA